MGMKEMLAEKAEVDLITNDMQEMLQEQFRRNEEEKRQKSLMEQKFCMKKVLMALFDKHHLLRTVQQEGVLSIHGSKYYLNFK